MRGEKFGGVGKLVDILLIKDKQVKLEITCSYETCVLCFSFLRMHVLVKKCVS